MCVCVSVIKIEWIKKTYIGHATKKLDTDKQSDEFERKKKNKEKIIHTDGTKKQKKKTPTTITDFCALSIYFFPMHLLAYFYTRDTCIV